MYRDRFGPHDREREGPERKGAKRNTGWKQHQGKSWKMAEGKVRRAGHHVLKHYWSGVMALDCGWRRAA